MKQVLVKSSFPLWKGLFFFAPEVYSNSKIFMKSVSRLRDNLEQYKRRDKDLIWLQALRRHLWIKEVRK